MSKERKELFIHPFLGFVVEHGMNIPTYHLRNHEIVDCIDALDSFALALDPKIKETLQLELTILRDMVEGRHSRDRNEIKKIMGKIYDELHKAGYFQAAKMERIDLSGLQDASGETSRTRTEEG